MPMTNLWGRSGRGEVSLLHPPATAVLAYTPRSRQAQSRPLVRLFCSINGSEGPKTHADQTADFTETWLKE